MRFLTQVMGLMLLLGLTYTDSSAQQASAGSEQAVKAWLALVDANKIDESLEATSDYFRQRVDVDNWQQTMRFSRQSMGQLISRELTLSETAMNLPGGPKGDYAIFEFTADYTNKKQAVESITMLLEDQQWRVIGYYVQ